MDLHRKTSLILVLALLATSALAQDVMQDRVKSMLELGVEDTPGGDAWRLIGVGAVEYLFTVARDSEEAPIYRQRATIALGHFPESRVPGLLTELAATEAHGPDLRAAAVTALSGSWPEEAISQAGSLLGEDDAYLRRMVVRALGEMLSPEAGELIQVQLGHEQDEIVRAEAEQALVRHRELRARQHLDALEITVTAVEDTGLKLSVSSPADGPAVMHLTLTFDTPDHLVISTGSGLLLELESGETSDVMLELHSTIPDGNRSFRILIEEGDRPGVERRVDVVLP